MTKLEELAKEIGVTPAYLRAYIHREIAKKVAESEDE